MAYFNKAAIVKAATRESATKPTVVDEPAPKSEEAALPEFEIIPGATED